MAIEVPLQKYANLWFTLVHFNIWHLCHWWCDAIDKLDWKQRVEKKHASIFFLQTLFVYFWFSNISNPCSNNVPNSFLKKKKKDLVRYNWHIAPKGYNLMFYIRILCSNRYHNQDDKYIHHSPKFPLDPFFINPLWHHSLQPQPCLQRSKLQIISQACLLEGINKLHCTEVCFLSL